MALPSQFSNKCITFSFHQPCAGGVAGARAQLLNGGFKVRVGIDPGRRDLITAVRREVGVDKERVISVNTKQLNRLAGFHRHQKKKMQKLQEAGKALPSWSGV